MPPRHHTGELVAWQPGLGHQAVESDQATRLSEDIQRRISVLVNSIFWAIVASGKNLKLKGPVLTAVVDCSWPCNCFHKFETMSLVLPAEGCRGYPSDVCEHLH